MKRVIQSGYFCGIDDLFWTAYCRRFMSTDNNAVERDIAIIAQARDSKTVPIFDQNENDFSILLKALFKLTAGVNREAYNATTSENELKADHEYLHFLFEVPLQMEGPVKRILRIPSLDILPSLPSSTREKIRNYLLAGGKELKYQIVARTEPDDQNIYGLFGKSAVLRRPTPTEGQLYESHAIIPIRMLDFNQDNITTKHEDFDDRWGRAISVKPEDLDSFFERLRKWWNHIGSAWLIIPLCLIVICSCLYLLDYLYANRLLFFQGPQ